MKTILIPSYVTPNTVCFKEEGVEVNQTKMAFGKPAKTGFLGSFYLKEDQLETLGWKPTHVGEPYETLPDRRGKTYTRCDVSGPNIEVSITVKP